MIVAQTFFFLIVATYLFSLDISLKNKRNFTVFLLLFMIILLELSRSYYQSFFGDIFNYRELFYEIQPLLNNFENLSTFKSVEPGFLTFSALVKTISDNFYSYLLVIALWQLYVYLKFFRKFQINPIGGYLIVFGIIYVTFYIGMLRQSIAMSFFLIALMKLKKSKPLFFLYSTIAVSFHVSAIFLIFLFWIQKKIPLYTWILISIASITLYLFQFDLVTSTIISFAEFLNLGNIGRVLFYLDIDRPNNFLGIGFWERIIFLTLSLWCYEPTKNYSTPNRKVYYTILFNLALSSIFLQLIFFASPTITSRLRYYLMIFPSLLVLQNIQFGKFKNLRGITLPLFIGYLSLQLYFQGGYLLE